MFCCVYFPTHGQTQKKKENTQYEVQMHLRVTTGPCPSPQTKTDCTPVNLLNLLPNVIKKSCDDSICEKHTAPPLKI